MTLAKLGLGFFLAAPFFGAETIPTVGSALIAHEWGTFTSVADAEGYAIPWTVLGGSPDLPCFVIRPDPQYKLISLSRVRMETPVLYFYTARPMTVSVGVRFPKGRLTEWYPQAASPAPGSLDWSRVELLPGERPELPAGMGASHYYAARETDATPLRVGKQQEKLLFYRGVGDFALPLQPVFTASGAVDLKGDLPAILFENRDGRVGFRFVNGPGPVATPELNGDLEHLRGALVEMLTGAGLYPKEARAMVETWRDSWFEEGMRVLYLMPRAAVDALLPLAIAPAPQEVARVFVGRIELLSPAMRETIGRALGERDIPMLQRYGRFLNAFAGQMPRSAANTQTIAKVQALQDAGLASSPGCVR